MVSSMSRKRGIAAIVRFFCLLVIAAAMVSCGGGGGGGGSAQQTPPSCPPCATGQTSFWATNMITDAKYCLCAQEIAVGTHSRIFAENALLPVTPAEVAWVIDAFDNQIYTTVTASFGSEPNPGFDGDIKITILLLNIPDGYPGTSSYTAGYFDPGNQYLLSANPYSNQREMFYMNANPALVSVITTTEFNTTLAHEFQHMIHWHQKVNLKVLEDDIWLNEAMSEIAPTAIYGPNYLRVRDYEDAPTDSLITWAGTVSDYGIVYMWAQYYKDRFGGTIFKSIMDQSSTGITSVNNALAAASPGATFDNTFSDLSIAIFLGSSLTVPGHPEWSYTSIDTAEGMYSSASGTVTLPGLVLGTNLHNKNPLLLPALGAYSIGFSWYEPSLTPPDGSVAWTDASNVQKAHFIDYGNGNLLNDITSGATYTYNTNGILIVRNPSTGSQPSGGNVVSFAVMGSGTTLFRSPSQMLAAANRRAQAEGRPRSICVHSAFTEREKEMRRMGHKPGF